MPNLVVYVPADVARALEAKGVSENLQRRACKEVLVGLAERGEPTEEGQRRVGLGPAVSPRSASPNGGLGSGEVPAQSPPVVAAVSPEPSPLDGQGTPVASESGKGPAEVSAAEPGRGAKGRPVAGDDRKPFAGSFRPDPKKKP